MPTGHKSLSRAKAKSNPRSSRAYDGVYSGENTSRISFPLGGLGTGCVGLAGNGVLIDWEIFGRPNLGGKNGCTHFAVRAESGGKVLDTRALHGRMPEHLLLPMDGLPHFSQVIFRGRYPFATLEFRDPQFPGIVRLTAFNPFIPGNDKDSTIPGAFFQIEIENTTSKPIRYSVAFSAQNPNRDLEGVNQYAQTDDGARFIHLRQEPLSEDVMKRRDLCIATDAADVSYSERWRRLRRGQGYSLLTHYWLDFCAGGRLKSRPFTKVPDYNIIGKWHQPHDHATLAAHVPAGPRKTAQFRFALTWNSPFQEDTSKETYTIIRRPHHTVDRSATWRNYYATLFSDSAASAQYALRNWDRLYHDTRLFADALHASTLPPVFLEAITANLAILKSPTVLRLEDGSFWAFEGSGDHVGNFFGSCTHVWQYACSLPYLYPSLERSMREIEIKYAQRPGGGLLIRAHIPLGSGEYHFRPAADGHFATVIRLYRDWKISGDTAWLRPKWEAIKKMISFAWAESNPDRWDRDRDGVIEGRQHVTYDNELFGPSAYVTGFYLTALKAAAEMARVMEDADAASLYEALYAKGNRWVQDQLYNGSYYIQKIDLHDKSLLAPYPHTDIDTPWYDDLDATGLYWDEEDKQVMGQIGDACFIDQLLSQWHASLSGLGDVFPPQRVRKTLQSILKHNFVPDMKDHFEPDGQFMALDGEGGIAICAWPEGAHRPNRPMRYADRFWPGCEYAFAALLVREGLIDEACKVAALVRNRFDGRKRNPWCEFEAGRYYARSMSSYSLLLAMSGFEYDMTRGMIGFTPKTKEKVFRSFWSVEGAWGTVQVKAGSIGLNVLYGRLELRAFRSGALKGKRLSSVATGATKVPFTFKDREIQFSDPITLDSAKESQLQIRWS